MANRVFHNTLPERLADKLDVAARLGIRPMHASDPDFIKVVVVGTAKWAVTLTGELMMIPKIVQSEELAHSVLTNGAPVLAAGEVELTGTPGAYFFFDLTNYSGHYQPDASSRKIGIQAFAAAGIKQL